MKLEPEHLKESRLFAHREQMLEYLPKRAVVAEIGTFKGEFARKIIDTCSPVQLHILDITFSFVKAGTIDDAIVTKVQGDSGETLGRYSDGFFDWIYVDGDHSLDGVRRDAVQAMRALKPGGFMVFNDYTIFDPLRSEPFGVIHVVNELCVLHGFKVVGLAMHRAGYQDIMLQKQ